MRRNTAKKQVDVLSHKLSVVRFHQRSRWPHSTIQQCCSLRISASYVERTVWVIPSGKFLCLHANSSFMSQICFHVISSCMGPQSGDENSCTCSVSCIRWHSLPLFVDGSQSRGCASALYNVVFCWLGLVVHYAPVNICNWTISSKCLKYRCCFHNCLVLTFLTIHICLNAVILGRALSHAATVLSLLTIWWTDSYSL